MYHTIDHPATVTLHCGDCQNGTYAPVADGFDCDTCGHQMTARDFTLEADEALVLVPTSEGKRAGYVAAEGDYHPFLSSVLSDALRAQNGE